MTSCKISDCRLCYPSKDPTIPLPEGSTERQETVATDQAHDVSGQSHDLDPVRALAQGIIGVIDGVALALTYQAHEEAYTIQERPTLTTARLVLRPLIVADTPDVQRLSGEREVASTAPQERFTAHRGQVTQAKFSCQSAVLFSHEGTCVFSRNGALSSIWLATSEGNRPDRRELGTVVVAVGTYV